MSKEKKQIVGSSEEDKKFPLPIYNKAEDIYNQEKEVPFNEIGKKEDKSMDDGLDIPGSELDDAEEMIGEEDEENNYYSLGGDNQNDLEESKE